MNFIELILLALSAPVLAWTFYLFVLTLFAGPLPLPRSKTPTTRFDVIVPAHNEERGVARTVASLRALDYPIDLFRVVVVADNCTDNTAARARLAGATVIERFDPLHRGKGYALAHGFEWSTNAQFANAVAVVDADTVVSWNLLRAFDVRFQMGALAAQAEYGVANPQASWRTRLLAIAFALFHTLRSNARERLGLSTGLRGNGMALKLGLLQALPYDAFSVVEDVEYGVRLGRAGVRVAYAHEAEVLGEMPASEMASRSQRRRWEGGRGALLRSLGWPLVRSALGGNRLAQDLAFDLLVPPLTFVVMGALSTFAVAVGISTFLNEVTLPLVVTTAPLLFLFAYFTRGILLSGGGFGSLATLIYAPGYMLWKVLLVRRRTPDSEGQWIRTMREGES